MNTPAAGASSPSSVDETIAAARQAARDAGLDVSDTRSLRSVSNRNISYAFDLVGLNSAPDVADVEDALEALPGVRARIIFPEKRAYITAPEDVGPSKLTGVMDRFGIAATLTDSSLRRRISGGSALDAEDDAERLRRVPWQLRRHLVEEARAAEEARRAGFLREYDARRRDTVEGADGDVLYTSRRLLAPWRLILAIILTVPVILVSYTTHLQFPGWQWMALACSTPVVSVCAWPFHRALAGGVRRGITALDGASALAIIVAYLWSAAMMFFTPAGEIGWQSTPTWFAFNHSTIDDGELFLDVACVMTVVLLGGRLLTMRTRTSLIDEMIADHPKPQDVVTIARPKRAGGAHGQSTRVPLQEVNVGDDVVVTTGQVIPVDGAIIGGSCAIDPGLVDSGVKSGTTVKVGDYVYAGERNTGGRIKVRVDKTGHQTRMAAIHRWVEEANYRQNTASMLSTRSASYLLPIALAVAVVDFLLWYLVSNNLNASVATALAVLAAIAPVALAISPSLAIRHGIESAARKGIMLRDGQIVRSLSNVDTVIINRLGTLTTSEITVENVVAERGENPELILRVAAALAMESDHPASAAIVKAARASRDRELSTAESDIPHWINASRLAITEDGTFTGMIELPVVDGDGDVVTRQVDAKLWRPRTMSDLTGRLGVAVASGGTPMVVGWLGKDRGVILLHDTVREDAEEGIAKVESQGVETIMISRDAYPVSRSFADRIGIDQVLAGIAPGAKLKAVRMANAHGASVAMVGDISVLPTMKAADVGILLGPTEALDLVNRRHASGVGVIMLPESVTALADLLAHVRRICRIVDGNIIISWVYNGLAVAAAISGLLNPMVATLLMVGSSWLIEHRSNLLRTFAGYRG
ncbi:heavy metal translocating P-type ATPase [Corynebacterium uterequi]|uniref:Cation transport ATPase n=1 Tax=Corynebacterium uterequi TaxID=1072256 RepID=A0A0G3HAC7_9CORY|nr:HAD family hydrolase [Corynebacterium uterequi]AKK10274.1 cation transport ATPase [Corynebacterium uterequi]